MTKNEELQDETPRSLDDYHDLGYLDKPLCPDCDRELGTAPGMDGLAFKCPAHGSFHSAEIDANPLDVMQRNASASGGVSAGFTVVPVLLAAAVITAAKKVAGVFTRD